MIGSILTKVALEPIYNAIEQKYKQTSLKEQVADLKTRYHKETYEKLLKNQKYDNWPSLSDFVDNNLFKGISATFLFSDKSIREEQRQQVYKLAYNHARADTEAKRREVDFFLKRLFGVAKNFYHPEHRGAEGLPFNQVVDQVHTMVESLGDDLETFVKLWGDDLKVLMERQTDQILSKLESLHNSQEYQNSFAKVVDGILLPPPINSIFHFRNSAIGFYGREEQISFLDGFLDRSESLLFTAVTGPAGVGKSKFLYEYIKRISDNPHWKAVFVHMNTLNHIMERTDWEYDGNLLVVIDYAGKDAREIGKWIIALRTGKRPHKMRIVLLEREGLKGERKPFWYERLIGVNSRDDIVTVQYAPNGMFLELPELSDSAFEGIVKDFAMSKNKDLLADDIKSIIKYCKGLEKTNQARPLILLFVTDARLRDDDYHEWDPEELFSRIIERYRERWKDTICEGHEETFRALEKLYVYVTATGGWSRASKLPTYIQPALSTMENFFNTPDSLQEVFVSLNEKNEWDDILAPLEPDLIGEFFVLEFLRNMHDINDMVETLGEHGMYLVFLFRAIEDYANADRFSDLFNNGAKKLISNSIITAYPGACSVLFFNLSCSQDAVEAMQTIAQLRELAYDPRYAENQEIVLRYAKGLFNLSCDQDAVEAVHTVAQLRELAYDPRYAENQEIVQVYILAKSRQD